MTTYQNKLKELEENQKILDLYFHKRFEILEDLEEIEDGFKYFIESYEPNEGGSEWEHVKNSFVASLLLSNSNSYSRILTNNPDFQSPHPEIRVQYKNDQEIDEVRKSLEILKFI